VGLLARVSLSLLDKLEGQLSRKNGDNGYSKKIVLEYQAASPEEIL
jgi:hypothetical protein